MKIDIEGHKFNALNGVLGIFEKDSIHKLHFEFGGCNIDTRTFFRILVFFKEYSMQIYRILPSKSISY
ncbi:MAG: hypothetical protein K2P17_06955 [Helicobacteraceae bacterium]|nr:hypothetical protein [Helicobacteraceae bacterium]